MKTPPFHIAIPLCLFLVVGSLLTQNFSAEKASAKIAQLPATPDAARTQVDSFLTAELTRLSKGKSAGTAEIVQHCSRTLQHLLAIEEARAAAYDEGFAAAKGDPANKEKPLFADSGYFVVATIEGEMSVKADAPQTRGDKVAVTVKFTSKVDGKSYDQGAQTVVLILEDGTWRIDDVEVSGELSLTQMLQRPKYMELPAKK